MQITSPHLELPETTRRKLEAYRRRVWWVKLAEGLLAGLCGLLISYLLVFALDRLVETPRWLRATIMLGGFLGLGIVFPLKWHRWVWRTRRLEQAAKLLRHKFPGLGDQLLGIVELACSELEQERSASLCRAAMRQVDASIQGCDFTDAVPAPRHRRWGWAAGGALLVSAFAWLVVPSAAMNALARWLLPWRDIDRYTFVQLQDLPETLVVPYAEPFGVTPRLAAHTNWSPRQATARYGRQATLHAPLNERGYEFSIPPQKTPDDLCITVGDTRKRVRVEPTPRPELTTIRALVKLPEYLQYSEELPKDARSGSLSVVAGSTLRIEALATRPLREAHVDGIPVEVQQNTFVASHIVASSTSTHTFFWRDALGLTSKDPFLLHITASADEAPTLSCRQLPREVVLLSTDVLTFQVVAHDDFGVKLVGLEWSGREDPLKNPHPVRGEKVLGSGDPQTRTLECSAALSPQRDGIPPQSLQVRLFAIDFLPGRERVYSPDYIIHVLSPEEHAIWLTRQLRGWFRQAQELYEREQQLAESNRQLRALEPAELDRPENRARIEQQAAAEYANAQRLSLLTQSGETLLEQAVRNEQFNVSTLEGWADMLRKLKAIASNRMPSVADLLTAAADAPNDRTAEPTGSPSPTDPAMQTGVNRDPRSAGSPPPESNPAGTVPVVVDQESSFRQPADPTVDAGPSPPAGPGGLKLPSTAVAGGGEDPRRGAEQSPAKQLVAQAVREQEELLAEFAEVAGQLKMILANLEGSTFVKRLKAASRQQLDVARNINRLLSSRFGVPRPADGEPDDSTLNIARREVAFADEVYVIQQDLEAYFNRVQEGKYRTVLAEMKSTQVVSNLQFVADVLRENLGGQSIARAEYWADALDRWAEQLVGPG